MRNHVKFPGFEERKSTIEKRNASIGEKRQKQTAEMLADRKKTKTRVPPSEKSQEGRTTHAESKQSKKSFSALKVGGKNTGISSVGSSISKKVKGNDASKKEMNSSMTEESNLLGGEPDTLYGERSKSMKFTKGNVKHNKASIVNPTTKKELPSLDADRKKRFLFVPLNYSILFVLSFCTF